jgi:KUP system potassium uptake protein
MFWSLVIVITVKYVVFIMRADNKGEGGIMALSALALRTPGVSAGKKRMIQFLGVCGLALFFGDGVITPSISVLSALEGWELVTPALKPAIVPSTIVILCLLFLFQRRGTEGVGAWFGPVMLAWFLTLAGLGIYGILMYPSVLVALNPVYAVDFFVVHQTTALVVLGAIFLTVTGAEALYADMGHFGRRPIQLVWLVLVFPALTLNYLGQGALILQNPETVLNPFYLLAPAWMLYPMLVLASAATIIASQAVISGAFSASRQAMQLGFLPRMLVIHTSSKTEGQVYVPAINWMLLAAVVILVLGFKSSSNLASAYGIAVTGAMAIDTALAFGIVLGGMMGWKLPIAMLMTGFFLFFDLVFFGANAIKIPDGGWFPLVLGAAIFYVMSTWHKGVELSRHAMSREEIPLVPFLRQFETHLTNRVEGVAVYMTTHNSVVPRALIQNLQHHATAHETVVFLSVKIVDVPKIDDHEKISEEDLGNGFHRVTVRFGFTERPDVSRALGQCRVFCNGLDVESTSFFLGRATFLAAEGKPGFPLWRIKLFLWMQRNAGSAASWFHIPSHRVVEMGSRVTL